MSLSSSAANVFMSSDKLLNLVNQGSLGSYGEYYNLWANSVHWLIAFLVSSWSKLAVTIPDNNLVIIYKLFNTIKYTTYIWSYKIRYDYFMTEQVYKHLEDYVSHNMIPNLLPNGKD